jgi:hypothetical protein
LNLSRSWPEAKIYESEEELLKACVMQNEQDPILIVTQCQDSHIKNLLYDTYLDGFNTFTFVNSAYLRLKYNELL